MRSKIGSLSAGVSLLALSLTLAALSPAFGQDADQDRAPMDPIHLQVNFAQTFQFGAPCPSTVPSIDTCIDATLSAPFTKLGPISVSRVAFVDASLYHPSTPTCIPVETHGTATLRGGTLTFDGAGSVCFVDGTASYNLIVTGGTGRYAGAIGGGQITVPPPTSNTTGRELWSVTLYLPH